ncbi:HD domain-containing phosphohydrolase [Pseudorhodoferax sp. Leaf274]|uniref:response regulator n=1 Tax=Pseudorhodoferax sp. Leaf274 TaxID=1736318 RepID=UPI000AF1B2C4|nr:HD domain-containing phosphohydrolase [Pseudorhodoferax sp. Leaf274]
MLRRRPILIVDDEPANLATLRQILADEHPLVFARDGAEALAAAHKHQPALVLLDIRMPDMDGYALCRRLKADAATRDTPVIFVTTLSEVGDEAAGFAAGGVDYIVKPVSPPIVRARVRTHLSLVRATALENSYRTAIFMLGEAGHYNDNDTGVHIWRMAAYARLLAMAWGWDPEHAAMLELAAPMHDTGKIGIPHTILCKPGKLDEQEWEIMRTHPRIGHDILVKSRAPVFQLAAEVALAHHERWDGSGYPQHLAGKDIPESARIVAIADVFDALSMRRPYKEPWPLERIMLALHEGAGSHFDPDMVPVFASILPQVLEVKQRWDQREADEGEPFSASALLPP